MSIKQMLIMCVTLIAVKALSFETLLKGSTDLLSIDVPNSVFIQGMMYENMANDLGVEISISNYLIQDTQAVLLYGENRIVYLDSNDARIVGDWPVTRWAHELHSLGFIEQQYGTDDEGVVANLPEETNLEYKQALESGINHLGCLANTPLRYGDIDSDSDSESELVLTLSNYGYKADLIVFSPKYQRIVFSSRYALQDADLEIRTGQDYQYRRDTSGLSHQRGYKVFSKVFIGDFDADEHPDIMVWRKRYLSKLQSESVVGFELNSQLWQHFERDLTAQAESEPGITGEYLPQDTPEEDIQNWLAENDLTWSKGYPSKSECPGGEGQLIPEMHDPLLNDPDVLQ